MDRIKLVLQPPERRGWWRRLEVYLGDNPTPIVLTIDESQQVQALVKGEALRLRLSSRAGGTMDVCLMGDDQPTDTEIEQLKADVAASLDARRAEANGRDDRAGQIAERRRQDAELYARRLEARPATRVVRDPDDEPTLDAWSDSFPGVP